MTDLVVIAGPIAAGKTTIAQALAERLRADGSIVALVELDEIAAMTARADWDAAHRAFAQLVAAWLHASVDVVVAEGPGSVAEIRLVVEAAAREDAVVRVVVDSPVELAIARAQADPTRGVSRDPEFLTEEYDRWSEERELIVADVRLDTASLSVREAVDAIAVALRG